MNSLKNVSLKLLGFLNLLDFSNKLSITNLAVYVIITKIAISAFDWASATTLFVVLLNYIHKRKSINEGVDTEQSKEVASVKSEIAAVTEQLNDMQSKISTVIMKVVGK